MSNNFKLNKVYGAVHGDSWLKQAHYCSLLMGVRLIKHSTPGRKANQLENLGHRYSQRKEMKVLTSTWEEREKCRWHGFWIHAYHLARYTIDLVCGGGNVSIETAELYFWPWITEKKLNLTFSPDPILVAFSEMTFFYFLCASSCL